MVDLTARKKSWWTCVILLPFCLINWLLKVRVETAVHVLLEFGHLGLRKVISLVFVLAALDLHFGYWIVILQYFLQLSLLMLFQILNSLKLRKLKITLKNYLIKHFLMLLFQLIFFFPLFLPFNWYLIGNEIVNLIRPLFPFVLVKINNFILLFHVQQRWFLNQSKISFIQ